MLSKGLAVLWFSEIYCESDKHSFLKGVIFKWTCSGNFIYGSISKYKDKRIKQHLCVEMCCAYFLTLGWFVFRQLERWGTSWSIGLYSPLTRLLFSVPHLTLWTSFSLHLSLLLLSGGLVKLWVQFYTLCFLLFYYPHSPSLPPLSASFPSSHLGSVVITQNVDNKSSPLFQRFAAWCMLTSHSVANSRK